MFDEQVIAYDSSIQSPHKQVLTDYTPRKMTNSHEQLYSETDLEVGVLKNQMLGVQEQLMNMASQISKNQEELRALIANMNANYVTQAQFADHKVESEKEIKAIMSQINPIRKVATEIVKYVLLAVLGALLALVINMKGN